MNIQCTYTQKLLVADLDSTVWKSHCKPHENRWIHSTGYCISRRMLRWVGEGRVKRKTGNSHCCLCLTTHMQKYLIQYWGKATLCLLLTYPSKHAKVRTHLLIDSKKGVGPHTQMHILLFCEARGTGGKCSLRRPWVTFPWIPSHAAPAAESTWITSNLGGGGGERERKVDSRSMLRCHIACNSFFLSPWSFLSEAVQFFPTHNVSLSLVGKEQLYWWSVYKKKKKKEVKLIKTHVYIHTV